VTNQERAYTLLLEEALLHPKLLQAFRDDLLHHDRKRLLEGAEDAVYTWVLRESGTEMVLGYTTPLHRPDELYNVYTLNVEAGTLDPVRIGSVPEQGRRGQ
jgi:hypothetical protein